MTSPPMRHQEGTASWGAVRREMAHRTVGRSNPSDPPRGGGIFWGLGLHPLIVRRPPSPQARADEPHGQYQYRITALPVGGERLARACCVRSGGTWSVRGKGACGLHDRYVLPQQSETQDPPGRSAEASQPRRKGASWHGIEATDPTKPSRRRPRGLMRVSVLPCVARLY